MGTPTISHIVNVIKEKEIDTLALPWVNTWVAYLLEVCWATATIEDGKPEESDPSDYDEIVASKEAETKDAFSSRFIHTKTWMAHMGNDSGLCVEDRTLPQGLMVQNAYMELHSGSKNITVVVRNSTAYPQTLRRKTSVARAVMVTWIPELPVQISLTEASEEDNSHQMPKLTVKQRQEKLLEELDLSGLESWSPELAASAWSLLAMYHDVFSLEPSELGCTHSTKHVIKVTNNTPFKEQFRWMPPPLLEEVHMHLQEMLDSGMICPSQSTWCNAVVLVQKRWMSYVFA